MTKEKPSRLWYLLPIIAGLFGGILGIIFGIIGYFILKDRDKQMATRVLILGVVMFVVWIVLAIVAYVYISQIFIQQASGAGGISILDASCRSGDSLVVTLRSFDSSTPIDTSGILIKVDDIPADVDWSLQEFGVDGYAVGIIECSGSVSCEPGSVHKLTVRGPNGRDMLSTVSC
jgi:hypothetical protein